MELRSVIEFLTHQKSMLDETIACLERLGASTEPEHVVVAAKRRGRKFMDAADRQKVSERMKEYWAARRSAKTRHAGASF